MSSRHLTSAPRGFTLVEVLVALAIVAVSLIAGLRAVTGMQRQAEREEMVTLAKWCITNQLADMRLSRQVPATGTRETTCTQAGIPFAASTTTTPTPNARFRRVDIVMSDPRREPTLTLTTFVGPQ